MKSLLEIYNSIIEFIDLRNLFSKQLDCCPNCGYIFKKKKIIYFNTQDCQNKFFLSNNKKQDRLIRKFERNRTICVICKNRLKYHPDVIGNICPKCRFLAKPKSI